MNFYLYLENKIDFIENFIQNIYQILISKLLLIFVIHMNYLL